MLVKELKVVNKLLKLQKPSFSENCLKGLLFLNIHQTPTAPIDRSTSAAFFCRCPEKSRLLNQLLWCLKGAKFSGHISMARKWWLRG